MASVEISPQDIEELLNSERIIRIGLDADGQRYLVPLGYVWLKSSIYCLTTPGKKTLMAKKNPHVSFQIDNSSVKNPFEWTSVIGEGKIQTVTDSTEIEAIRPILFGRFQDIPEWASKEYEERHRVGALVCLRIIPEIMTGRRNSPIAE
ncbi:MAG: hypothetical protein HOH43_07730 [Candidatus Latescibacteria bacterium]|nr:hypothetical protein [Candidatus Latescibacterota bacterium]